MTHQASVTHAIMRVGTSKDSRETRDDTASYCTVLHHIVCLHASARTNLSSLLTSFALSGSRSSFFRRTMPSVAASELARDRDEANGLTGPAGAHHRLPPPAIGRERAEAALESLGRGRRP